MTTEDLYGDVRSAFSLSNTQENEILFLSSLRSVVVALNRVLKTGIKAPTIIDSSDIGFPDYCDAVFYSGVKYYIQRLGRYAADPDAETLSLYENELRRVLGPAIEADTTFTTRNQEQE